MADSSAVQVPVSSGEGRCPDCDRVFSAKTFDEAPDYCIGCGIKMEVCTYRSHYVHDQGGGGSLCDNCGYSFGGSPLVTHETCPGCRLPLREGEISIQSGGSDFD